MRSMDLSRAMTSIFWNGLVRYSSAPESNPPAFSSVELSEVSRSTARAPFGIGLQPAAHLDAVHHRHAHVRNHQVGHLVADHVERLLTVVGVHPDVAIDVQYALHDGVDGGFVVNDQYACAGERPAIEAPPRLAAGRRSARPPSRLPLPSRPMGGDLSQEETLRLKRPFE